MQSVESVLPPIRQDWLERTWRKPGQLLEKALAAGSGHVAVIGATHDDAAVFVDSVLARATGYDVAYVSIRRLVGAEHTFQDTSPDRVTVVVVADAESASATALERLRGLWEETPHAIARIRLLLVGAQTLERTLAADEARALASRIGTRIRLAPRTGFQQIPRPGQRPTTRRWALVASAMTAGAAVALLMAADLPVSRGATAALGAAAEGAALFTNTVLSVFQSSPRSRTVAVAPPSAASTPGQAQGSAVAAAPAQAPVAAAPGAETAPSPGQPSRLSVLVDRAVEASRVRSLTSGRDDRAATMQASAARAGQTRPSIATAAAPATPNAARPATWPSSHSSYMADASAPGLISTVVRLFLPASVGGRVIEAGNALIESVLMAARLIAAEETRPGINRPVQLGAYPHAKSAFALKRQLVSHFDRVAVARFDPPTGPFFSVRVFDPEGSQPNRSVVATAPKSPTP